LPPDAQPRAALVDLHVFGEAGLLAVRRDDSGRPQPIHPGPVTAPRGAEGAVLVGECMATEAGTLALAGAMVPLHAFGAAGERGRVDYFAGTESGFLDTGYAVQVDPASHTLTVAGYPAGTVGVGGYRFAARRLEQAVARADAGATIGCTADPLTGQRLLGSVANAPVLQQALDESGLCPLIAAAFAETFEHPAASAA
jgi:hypothetical protein